MESKDTRYNGWKNYETWAVKLWLDNAHPNLYHEWLEDAKKQAVMNNDNQDPTGILADIIKEWIEENNPLNTANLYTDLLNAALSVVDYYEVAEFIASE